MYSGVVSLQAIRLICFAAELNNLELVGTDISNAYLEAYTGDPLVFTAGPEFGDLEGHTMVVVKALYGIPGSGHQWAERWAAILRAEGWEPCRADHDVWMKRNGNVYEYIGIYVDDLIIASKNPDELLDVLVKVDLFFFCENSY